MLFHEIYNMKTFHKQVNLVNLANLYSFLLQLDVQLAADIPA